MTPAQAILIVDRHGGVYQTLEEQLAATNYALLHARDGEEAIALLERLKSNVELAIVAVEFPDLGGWDLIGVLAHHDQRPGKIIATVSSIYANEVLADQMKALGVDVVVRKPMPDGEWRTTVEKLLAGG
jgi:CheY-like chemotaxis protein